MAVDIKILMLKSQVSHSTSASLLAFVMDIII